MRISVRQARQHQGSEPGSGVVPGENLLGRPKLVHPLLRLQTEVGNRAVGRSLPANWRVSVPSDSFEHEAAKAAEQAPADLEPWHLRVNSEQVFDQGRGGVRLHTDVRAAEMAEALNARAFTVGQHIFFGPGEYAPGTLEGRKLLAHELAHTVQQTRGDAGHAIMRAPKEAESESKPLGLSGSEIPAPAITRVEGGILATVYFGQGFFLLDSLNYEAVQKLAEELRFMADPIVVVDGYASSEGTEEFNSKLSENRRRTVIAILSSRLIGATKFSGTAYGESKPAAPEAGKKGAELESSRALNRRVVIFIASKPAATPARPIDLRPKIKLEPETPEDKLKRILEEPTPEGPPRRSLSEMAEKKLDEAVDDILRKAGVPKKYRPLIKKAARSAVEGAAEKALDSALDQTPLSGQEKQAVKAAIKAAAETKF